MAASAAIAQLTSTSQMESLDMGLVAVPSGNSGNFVSWRLLGTDNKNVTTFDLLRDGETIATDLKKTNYQDAQGTATSRYQVLKKVSGNESGITTEVTPWGQKYLSLKLDRPAGGVHYDWGDDEYRTFQAVSPYAYCPNEMSVGDVDGDGQYELILKWESTHEADNHDNYGHTGISIIDCYKIDRSAEGNCRLLWRIDLGKNIRDGAHYTQFMVYDFDGDGKAEMMCKTAAGSKDGLGNYVTEAATDVVIKGQDNSKDYRNDRGHIIKGPELLTVFNGETGAAIHTTWYLPGRAGTGSKTPSGKAAIEGGCELGRVSDFPKDFWGDDYGNRSERFLGGVAYVNGADKTACGIFGRGYYTKAYVWAVSFDGQRLHTEWLHCSPNRTQWLIYTRHPEEGQTGLTVTVDGDELKRIPLKTAPTNTGGLKTSDSEGGYTGSNTLFSNGNHNLSVADVDGDGFDEIIYGSSALDHDGTLLYATGYGHGDAIHLGKLMPDREGLQVFQVHEEKMKNGFGSWDIHDACTGEILQHGGPDGIDNGRGMAGDLTGKDGYEFWSSGERTPRNAVSGKSTNIKNCSVNYRIYWDGSVQDQLFDGGYSYARDVIDGMWLQTSHADPVITKWNGSKFTTIASFNTAEYNYGQSSNYTKATPVLQADLLGDWREELILWNRNDSSEIMLYTTTIPTQYAVPTLMHDHVYRMGICWQNTAYNQPPHLGYYLPDYVQGKIDITGIRQLSDFQIDNNIPTYYDINGCRLNGPKRGLNIIRKGGQIIKIILP